jgi:hypothetical protein
MFYYTSRTLCKWKKTKNKKQKNKKEKTKNKKTKKEKNKIFLFDLLFF